LVLGRGFIRESDHSGETNIFARSNYGDGIFDDREVWELTYGWRKNETEFVQALKILLNEED